jgi:uncharacterized protein
MTAVGLVSAPLETRVVLRGSFLWMTLGLVITSIAAWWGAQSAFIVQFVTDQPVAAVVSMVAWLVLTIAFPWLVRRLPLGVGVILFVIYTAFGGVALSNIFTVYTEATIVYALVSTVALFAVITVAALFTTIDITRWTWYIVFGFLGTLIAGVLNLFLFRSPTLDLLISIGGVVLFSASTAWTVQRLDRTTHELPPTMHSRAALIGGAMLYTNFINLFMRLLAIYARMQKK